MENFTFQVGGSTWRRPFSHSAAAAAAGETATTAIRRRRRRLLIESIETDAESVAGRKTGEEEAVDRWLIEKNGVVVRNQ